HVRVSHRQLLNTKHPLRLSRGGVFYRGEKYSGIRKNIVHSCSIFRSYIKQIVFKEQIWFIN
ncbi:hypothetical protein NCZ17_15995, partial [Acinetobacter modestus]|uniref:hypothetical protein n=1 Tax=Acinetobacter modestus TaxID=1776740 RepID=UPI00202E44FA